MEEETQGHWTEKLFVKHADVFLRLLEKKARKTRKEVDAILGIFSKQGVPSDGDILDVCCGIGRHAVPLAELGYRVVGVDMSSSYIRRAREEARSRGAEENTEFLVADIRRIGEVLHDRGGSFDAIIEMYNSIGYYGEEGDLAVFRQLRALINPEGTFVIDAANRDHVVREFRDSEVSDWGDLILHDRRVLDLETSHLKSTWNVYGKRGRELEHVAEIEIDQRIYGLHELKALLEQTGWMIVDSYGSWSMDPLDLGSSKMILVSKPEKAR